MEEREMLKNIVRTLKNHWGRFIATQNRAVGGKTWAKMVKSRCHRAMRRPSRWAPVLHRNTYQRWIPVKNWCTSGPAPGLQVYSPVTPGCTGLPVYSPVAVTQHTTACCSMQVIDITLAEQASTNITSLRMLQQKHCGPKYKLNFILLQTKAWW
jgi:hypothetical protein